MKYVITESKLKELIFNSILEQKMPEGQKQEINQILKNESQKAKSHFLQHFSKSDTVVKFSNKKNIDEVKKFIPTIGYVFFSEKSGKNGFVNRNKPQTINLNLNNLFVKNGNRISSKGSLLYDTILHEMAHLIDFKLQSLKEKTILKSDGYYSATGGDDAYVLSDVETYARIQRLRDVLELSPTSNGQEIKNKLIRDIQSQKFVFPNVKISNSDKGLIFKRKENSKGLLTDLWKFYSPIRVNGTSVPDISALFAKYSKILEDKSIFLDLDSIGKINISTKAVKT